MNRDGTRIIVGAYYDDEGTGFVGAAYVLDLVHDYGKATSIHQVSAGSLGTLGFDVSYGFVDSTNTGSGLFLKDSNMQPLFP